MFGLFVINMKINFQRYSTEFDVFFHVALTRDLPWYYRERSKIYSNQYKYSLSFSANYTLIHFGSKVLSLPYQKRIFSIIMGH